jgi:uncharacterized protein (DUF305 family)
MRKTKIALAAFALSLAAAVYLPSCGNGDNKQDNTNEQPADGHKEGDGHDHGTAGTDSAAHSSDNAMMKAMNDMMDRMSKMQMTGDFDHDFAAMMIEHHQGAVDMAQIEMQSGKDEKIKSMAQNIIATQKAEQEKLRTFVSGHTPKPDHSHSHGDGQGHNELQEAMNKMMDQMKGMQMSGDTDKDFVMMMIPHHQSAVDMAKNELSHGKEVEIKQMAQKMIADQNKEIKEFQSWLDSHK